MQWQVVLRILRHSPGCPPSDPPGTAAGAPQGPWVHQQMPPPDSQTEQWVPPGPPSRSLCTFGDCPQQSLGVVTLPEL